MIEKIGVIGSGQMGTGIAHVCALSGFDVVLVDIDPEALSRALQNIDRNIDRQIARGKISPAEKAAALQRIRTSQRYDALADCDLVVEAATENEDIKREVFKTLVPLLKPGAIIATNTSSISITRLAAVTDRPGRFIG